jgi:hypothetical protein
MWIGLVKPKIVNIICSATSRTFRKSKPKFLSALPIAQSVLVKFIFLFPGGFVIVLCQFGHSPAISLGLSLGLSPANTPAIY